MIRRTFLTHALGVGGLALLPGWLRAQSMDHSMHDMAGMDHSMSTPLPQELAASDALPRGAALGPLHRLSNQSSQPGLFKAELSPAETIDMLDAGILIDQDIRQVVLDSHFNQQCHLI